MTPFHRIGSMRAAASFPHRLACIGADMHEGTSISQVAEIFGELCGALTEVRCRAI